MQSGLVIYLFYFSLHRLTPNPVGHLNFCNSLQIRKLRHTETWFIWAQFKSLVMSLVNPFVRHNFNSIGLDKNSDLFKL